VLSDSREPGSARFVGVQTNTDVFFKVAKSALSGD
jgi:hypothetical protein